MLKIALISTSIIKTWRFIVCPSVKSPWFCLFLYVWDVCQSQICVNSYFHNWGNIIIHFYRCFYCYGIEMIQALKKRKGNSIPCKWCRLYHWVLFTARLHFAVCVVFVYALIKSWCYERLILSQNQGRVFVFFTKLGYRSHSTNSHCVWVHELA